MKNELIDFLTENVMKGDLCKVEEILNNGIKISKKIASDLLYISVCNANNVDIFVAFKKAGYEFKTLEASAQALYHACRYKNLPMLKQLVLSGISVNLKSKLYGGATTLISAIDCKNKEMIDFVLTQNPDLNIQNDNKDTALITAIETDQLDVVKNLILLKAKLDIKGYGGKTALMYVARSRNKLNSREILKLLNAAGANPNINDNKGDLPFMFLIQEPEILKECITKKVDLEKEDIHGQSILYLAAYNGFLKTVEVLLNAGALPNPNNIRSKYNKLPLVAASGQGHIDIVKLLIDRGAEINRQEGRNRIEDTALTAATKNKRIEIVQYLLSRGADASISLLYSGTALDIAINRKLPEIAELLAKYSAQP